MDFWLILKKYYLNFHISFEIEKWSLSSRLEILKLSKKFKTHELSEPSVYPESWFQKLSSHPLKKNGWSKNCHAIFGQLFMHI